MKIVKQLINKTMTPFIYKNYMITLNPLFTREWRFNYVHLDYDGPGDTRHGDCKKFCECLEEIEELNCQ